MTKRFLSTITREITGFYKPLYLHSSHLSFSPNASSKAHIIGQVQNQEQLHVGFQDNPEMKQKIITLLESTYTNCNYLTGLARTQPDGWMPITDGRMPWLFSRTPEPDDIFGMVLVQNHKIVPGTFQPMPTHRLLTINGLFQLPAEVAQKFFKFE